MCVDRVPLYTVLERSIANYIIWVNSRFFLIIAYYILAAYGAFKGHKGSMHVAAQPSERRGAHQACG